MNDAVASEGAPRKMSRLKAAWAEAQAAAREAARDLPPSAREAAVATLVGAPFLVVANALDIAITVGMDEGVGPRALHHFFDALEILAVAAWLALPLAVAAALPIPRKHAWSGWVVHAGAVAVGMWLVLGGQLERQAHAAFNGFGWWLLLPLYVVLCGMMVPAAYCAGVFATRLRWGWLGALILGCGGLGAHHFFMRDDYPSVHVAMSWVSMCVAGGALAPRVLRWLSLARWRTPALWVAAAAAGLGGVLFAPSNAVRVQLFRQPGAVAPWVLAQVVWAPPSLSAHAEAPVATAIPPEIMQKSLEGIPEAPVVVLVTVDALRGDVISSTKREERYPEITRLKQSGTYFRHAVSPGSQTSVSLTTLFANRYFSQMRWGPHGKGKMRFLYAAGDPSPRFPELLAEGGVGTKCFLPIIFLSQPFGIARGFTDEVLTVDDRRHAMAQAVMDPLIKTLEKHKDGAAFFYVHVMEPHEPYDRGKVKEGRAWNRYLSEVEVVDTWIGRLVKTMRRRFPGRGYIVLSADHGEAFGEHGTWFHTKTLYDELLSVPLIVWGPSIERQVVDTRVGLIDVGPTILHLFRQPIPDSYMGRSLLPLIRKQVEDLPRPLMAEGRLRRAMYTPDGIKVIEDTVRKTVEVYDLRSDPRELKNLFDSDPERAHPPVAALRAFYAEQTLLKEGYRPPFKP